MLSKDLVDIKGAFAPDFGHRGHIRRQPTIHFHRQSRGYQRSGLPGKMNVVVVASMSMSQIERYRRRNSL